MSFATPSGMSIASWNRSAFSGLRGLVGPIIDTLPSVDAATAIEGVQLTGAEGAASPRGGGTVTFVEEWRLGGTQDLAGATYTPDAADAGTSLVYRVTWTETGGTADGTTVRSVFLGPVLASARIISVTPAPRAIIIEYEGTATITTEPRELILEVA